MAIDDEQAARRVMAQFGDESRIPYVNVEEGDVGVLVGFPVAGLFLAGLTGVDGLAFPLVLAGLGFGAAVVYITPAHLTAWEWLSSACRYATRPRVTYSTPETSEAGEGDATRNEGGLANRTPFAPDERAQDLTGVERAWSGRGAVQRTDGALEAFVELSPANMDFAMSGDWAQVQRVCEEFANKTLDCKLTFHATTRAFPVDSLVEQMEARLTDGDVAGNPVFRALVEEYRATRPREMRERGIQEVRYFVGVEVDEREVYTRYQDEHTPVEKLTGVPVVGFLFNPFVTRRADLTGAELREKQFEKLDQRVETVRDALVRTTLGWSARRLSTAELFVLAMDFWNGDEHEYGDPGAVLREREAVGRSPRPEATGQDDGVARQSADHFEGRDNSETAVAEAHRTLLAPAAVEWETRAARVGEQWTRTLYVAGYPDAVSDGYLGELFDLTDVEFDLTVHVAPKDQGRARAELQEIADDLQVDADMEATARGVYLQERADEATATYTAVENGQRVFDQAVYVTVRADDRVGLREAAQKVQSTLRDDPANLTPKTAICAQDLALRSAAPVGTNRFGRSSIALGEAVGALLASAHNATILEPGGVEVGVHRDTRGPVVVDPFARENGYATFTVGDTGSGKSFCAKQQFVRSMAQRPDRVGVILEPLNDWVGVAEALDATRITVGGTLGLNPLEIRPTPPHVQCAMGEDASPFNEKLDDAMSFLANFFALRGVPLDDRRTTLELGLLEAYARKGITDDVASHGNESPTVRNVLDFFEDVVADPEAFVVRSNAEAEKLRADATWLLDQLRPFEAGGRFANLGRPTAFDLRDERVLYLDLAQREGSVDASTALTMQLLVSLVYELAKETDREVVFVIDEARYVMQDAASLAFLETVFRHHRHHDLSVRLVTQTVDEFFQHPESEAILDQCAVKQFHRLDGMDDHWAEEFGLNYAQMRYVQEALPGSEQAGYAEALLGVDGEWRGIEVRAMPLEQRVIDFDPATDDPLDIGEHYHPGDLNATKTTESTRRRRGV